MNWTAETIKREIDYADQFMRSFTTGLRERITNYHGKYFGSAHTSNVTDVANHSFDYVSIMLPQALFTNPETNVNSARGGSPEEVARSIRAGLTRWMKDSEFLDTFERLVVDQFFFDSVALVSQRSNLTAAQIERMPKEIRDRFEKDDGGEGSSMSNFGASEPDKPMWPTLARIAPWMFFFDPACEDYSEARFAGHKFFRPRDELIARAEIDNSWNKKMLREATALSGAPSLMTEMGMGETPQRDDLLLCEFWVRSYSIDEDEFNPDSGYNGTIFTLLLKDADGVPTSDFVRKPRPFYGPPSGPYHLGGVYPVPNSPMRLAPLAVTEQQVRDLNALEHSVTESAKNYKRLIAVNQSDAEDAKRLNSALHGWMVALQGIERGDIQEIEIGGATEQQIGQTQYVRERLERSSGLSEAVLGNVTGVATATENAIANDSASVRLGYVIGRVEKYAAKILTSIAWYLYHDDKIVFPVGPDDFAPVEGAGLAPSVEMWFSGGSHDKDEGYTFSDLELSIEPGSMQKRNTARRRGEFIELMGHTMQVVQAAPIFPWVKWDAITKKLGELFDMKGWEKNFDFAQAGQSVALMNPEPKAAGQVSSPDKKPSISINAGGGRNGGPKPPTPKMAGPAKKETK